jgi:ATP-dependent Clp protease, protease subunit
MLIDRETKEIYVYGPIGGSFWEDGITAELMVAALSQMGDSRVTIRINSPGGVADEGIAIYNALRRHKGGVDTVIDSVAASAASIIALAGEKRTTAKGGKWMIHRALTFAIGNYSEMLKVANTLKKYDESLVEIYGEYMDADASEIESLMDEETWYTGSEAIAAGLGTADDLELDAAPEPAVASWYKHAPEAIAASSSPIVVPKFPTKLQAAEIRNRAKLRYRY